jgi:diketogulonate reductase-like aldo/keto reductase
MEHERESAVAALRRGLDLGLTHLDTAEMYGAGAVEELVAEAIEGRRHELYLVSKVLPSNSSFDRTLEACERSLVRLRTDHLDLYLLHWRGRVPLEETFSAFERLREQGKIKAWGVSNFDQNDLKEAVDLVGEGRIACNQVLYHLGERHIEHEILPWCQEHEVPVVAYSPFGSGFFPPAGDVQVLGQIAEAHGATGRQVALAFLLRHPDLLAIPKASSAAHVEENAAAGDLQLTIEELARLDAAFPLGRPKSWLPMI